MAAENGTETGIAPLGCEGMLRMAEGLAGPDS